MLDAEDKTQDQPDEKGNEPTCGRHTPSLFGAVICQCYDPGPEPSVYENNRILFLVQSCLLGISYSIIWPTSWIYVTREFKDLDPMWQLALYGTTFVAYPLASMLAAHILQKVKSPNIPIMFLLLNATEIVGNLVYAMDFHPALLFLGRFIAGAGDAFFVVVMADARITRNYKGRSLAAQCLAAFILGLLLAQVLNVVCFYIPYHIPILNWSFRVWNLPSVLTAILFGIFGITLFPTLKMGDAETASVKTPQDFAAPTEPTPDDGPGCTSTFVCFFSFVHTLVVTMLEVLLPMFIYRRLSMGLLVCIGWYIFLVVIYAMIFTLTMSIDSPLMLEFSLIVSVILKMVALLCVVLMTAGGFIVFGAMLAMMGVLMSVAFVWSNDDIMYTNLILTLVAYRHREKTNNMRKTASKFGFVLAGVGAPFLFNHVGILYASVTLIAVVGLLFGLFITLRMFGRALRKD